MDPLSGISLAGNILQFLDFATNIISQGHEIYRSSDGAGERNLEIEAAAKRLFELNKYLPGTVPHRANGNAFDHGLMGVANSCSAVAKELLEVLEKLKVEGKHRKWKSLQQAFKTIWTQDKVDKLVQRMAQYRQEMLLQLLVPMR